MPKPHPARGVAYALTCLVLLGFMPIISNSRAAEMSALGFAFWLTVWETIFALPLFLWELRGPDRGIIGARLDRRTKTRTAWVTLGMGVVFGLSTWLYVLSIEKAGAANAAVAIQTYPIHTIFWEYVLLRRRKTALELAITAVLVATLYYLGTSGTWRLSGLSPWFLVALSVPFLWAIAHVMIKEELGRTPITPAQVTFIRVGLSTVFLGAVLAVSEPAAFAMLSPKAQGWAALMGLVYYLELVIWFYAMRHIDVSFGGSITAPWPALTMVLAVVFLGEAIAPYQVGAVAVVIVAIWALTWAGLAKARRAMS
ncbi:MAG: DMT family transporter [Maritimibacter sp.]|nr:DMT family transporter [Maritimibacter sp.]